MRLYAPLAFFLFFFSGLTYAQNKPINQPSSEQIITTARKAANAIQDKNYAVALKILSGNDAEISAIAAKDPQFSTDLLLHLKATAQFQLKKYADAEATCDALIQNHPKSPWVHKAVFLKAKTYTARNDYEKALEIYKTESARLFATERKAEIAQSLIRFAESFSKQPEPNDIGARKPDYDKAYKLYAEVLELNCDTTLRAEARYQMTRMCMLSHNYRGAEKEALAYLKEFDPTWRGIIGSPERVTMKKNTSTLATGKQVAEVRLLHGEALHRANRRREADGYLFELIQLIKSGAIKSDKALLADATWLRLQTLRKKGGIPYDMDEWDREAIDYLKTYPNHIHANHTAYLRGYLLQHQKKNKKAILAYQQYIDNAFHTDIKSSPLTRKKESSSAFEARKKRATTHLESAHYAIGQIYLDQGEFDLARKAWSKTTQLFPNGSKWADCQKGLVEIDHAQLLHQLKELKKNTTVTNELDQAKKANLLISSFIAQHPLDPRIAQLLYQGGMIPYQRGKSIDKEKVANKKERQDKLYHYAINAWNVLLSKYSKSCEASRAKFIIATLWEEHFSDMEKAIAIYKTSKSREFRARLASLTSKRLIASTEHTFKLSESPQITLHTRNIKKVKIRQYWIDLESYFLKNGNLQEATKLDVDLVEPDHTWEVAIKGYKKYQPITQKIDIPFPKGKPGVCIIKIEDDQFFTTSLVMRSNIDLAVRTGKDELIAYVMNWETGRPAANVKLLLASGEKIIATETTGEDGVMRKKLPALKDLDQLRILAISPDGSATCQQDLGRISAQLRLKPKAWFHTASSENRLGSTVRLFGVVRDASDESYILPKNRSFTLTCHTRGKHAIFKTPITLDEQGGFETEFKIPNNTRAEVIRVELTSNNKNNKDSEKLRFSYLIPIVKTAPYRADIKLTFEKDHVNVGDILKGKVTATYRWGAPVSNRRIRITLPSGKTTDITSDAKGEAAFLYDTTGIASGSALTFSADLLSVSCPTTTRSLFVDPLQLYIRAESDKSLLTKNEPFTINVTTRNASKKTIGAKLSIKLIESKGSKESVIQTVELTTDATTGKGQTTLKIPKEGNYIVRIEGTDPQGKPSLTEASIRVLGENTGSALTAYHHAKELFDDGTIDLQVFSKLKSQAQALLTIEGYHIISHQIITLKPGSNQIPLKLSPKHAPFFRASIMCMHKRKFYATNDLVAVQRKLKITTKLSNLKEDHAQVGTTIEAQIQVTDTAGNPVPALLIATLNPTTQGKNTAKTTSTTHLPKTNAVAIYTPFQRFNTFSLFTTYSMSTSCGFSFTGNQDSILTAIIDEEQRQAIGNDRVQHQRGPRLVQRSRRIPNMINNFSQSTRSGDYAITRDSIDSILNDSNRQMASRQIQRNSIDFYLNNPNRQSTIRSKALSLAGRFNGFYTNSNRINIPSRAYLLPELPNAIGVSPQIQEYQVFQLQDDSMLSFGQSNNAYSPQEQLPHWSSHIQLITSGKSTQKIKLPKQAGLWKLAIIAVDTTGRLAADIHTITTFSPLTLKFSELSQVMAKDSFSPSLTVYRNNSEKKETFQVVGHINLGNQIIQKINQSVTLNEKQSNLTLTLPRIVAPASGNLTLFANIEYKGKKYQASKSITIRPYGVPVASRHSQTMTAGTTSFDIQLQKNAIPHHLNLRIRKDINLSLYQLATETNEPLFGWKIACSEPHPAGQLLAQVAVLDYLTHQGSKGSKLYNKLLKRARWTLNDLLETQHRDGSWSVVHGRKRSSLITTATAYEALQRWQALGYDKTLSTAKTSAWLKKQLSHVNSNQYDARCLIQQSLSYGKSADFSICNRLYRDRGLLSDVGRVLLAQAFLNLERPAFAKTLIEGMGGSQKRTQNIDPLTHHPAWLAGRTLSVIASLAKSDPILKKKAKTLYQTILSHAGTHGFTNDFVRGSAVAGLAAWSEKSTPSDFTAEIFVNGTSLGKVQSDQPPAIDTALRGLKLKLGANTIKVVVEGKGSLVLSATLTGILPEFPKTDGKGEAKKLAVRHRYYYHEQPTFKGLSLKAPGRSIAKEVGFQKLIHVRVNIENQDVNRKEVTLIEQIPAGCTYLKGSLKGRHSGARFENQQLIVTFQDNFKPRWISYTMIATYPGQWHQLPSTLFPIDAPERAVFGNPGSLTLLPAGKKSSDPYKMTYEEHRELAKLHAQYGESKEALYHLAALRKLSKRYAHLNEDAEIARITLWLETAKKKPETPNAKLLVESFETLNARMPELSIPFDKILKVGEAYRELKEFERGHYVFEATLEAGFAQDAYIGAALEDQGRFLDAIDYQKSIWQLYPDHGEITNTWFAMAQELYDRSSQFKTLKPRLHAPKDTKIKEADLIAESQKMLDQFLYLHPEHPSADDVSYTMANTLFALKDYRGVVAQARRCYKRYPKSNYRSSFRYMEALGSFWLRDYDTAIKAASEVARGDSQDKDLATFITAQIFHAKGQPEKAMKWYRTIKDKYPDARESIAYFEQKKISLDEVKVLSSGKKATINVKYRNIQQAKLKIYRVDLMKLYLKQKNLSNITNIELAGIAPKYELTIDLPQGDMTEDLEKSVTLPLKKDGAYLILCRGDYLYTSGLVLITPLKLEVQEFPDAGSLRVHIKDRSSHKLLDNVHVKAIGSHDKTFRQGETDLRGIWKAENLTGKPTVIARDPKGRYVFFRSKLNYGRVNEDGFSEDPFGDRRKSKAKQKIDFKGNLKLNQSLLNSLNKKSYNDFRRQKGKGVKVKKAMKK